MDIHFVKTRVQPHGMAPAREGTALRLIETCGRTAYKSEDKIREGSAVSFVVMLKNLRHLSVLEHSNATLKIEPGAAGADVPPAAEGLSGLMKELVATLQHRNAYHRVCFLNPSPQVPAVAVSGNFRSWIETLDYLAEKSSPLHALFASGLNRFYPSLFPAEATPPSGAVPYRVSLMGEDEQLEHLKRNPGSDLPAFVFRFICDRGITHEIVRHRVFSFTQESTRYVNYRDTGMVLILPEELEAFYDSESGEFKERNELVDAWLARGETLFRWYREDLERGLKPQIARDILPNLLKSEIFVTGRWSGWKHFLELRDSPKAHPRIRDVARAVRSYFDSIGITEL